jgi:FlaG/FlaF family flagellin (archaellin)
MGGSESGKKDLIKRENAVSEIMGVALLLGIVVIMLSFEGAFIFARSGPEDLPHAKLQEWMDTSEDKIYLKHCNGEPIKIEELEIAANINGNRYVYNSSNAYTETGNNGYWELGEMIILNASSEWKLDLKDYDDIDLYIIDTPTKELIQKSRLTTDFRKSPYEIGWITPRGYAFDNSSGSATLENVQSQEWEILNAPGADDDPDAYTVYHPPKRDGTQLDENVYQEFDFGINPCIYGFRPGDSLSKVLLKIIYRTNDNSPYKIQLRFYDLDGHIKYDPVYIPLPEKNKFNVTVTDITAYVNTTEDLANFRVRIEAASNANNEDLKKEINIDYLALWIQ